MARLAKPVKQQCCTANLWQVSTSLSQLTARPSNFARWGCRLVETCQQIDWASSPPPSPSRVIRASHCYQSYGVGGGVVATAVISQGGQLCCAVRGFCVAEQMMMLSRTASQLRPTCSKLGQVFFSLPSGSLTFLARSKWGLARF